MNTSKDKAMSKKKQFTNALVVEFRPLVKSIVRAMMVPGVEFKDMLQEGLIALGAACEDWEPGRGASFKSIVNLRVRTACMQWVSDSRLIRVPVEDRKRRKWAASIWESKRHFEVSLETGSADVPRPPIETLASDLNQEDELAWKEFVRLSRSTFSKLSVADQDAIWETRQDSVPEAAKRLRLRRECLRDRLYRARSNYLAMLPAA